MSTKTGDLSYEMRRTVSKITDNANDAAVQKLGTLTEEAQAQAFYQVEVEKQLAAILRGDVPGAKLWKKKLAALLTLATAALAYNSGPTTESAPTAC